ncbi:MAG: NADH-quinone oxidoreductase subunit D [Dehalococcoidia bacterium]|nr:NADH-quinone oxidoreductase subunit D [Dehalococcoidia bacterium]MCA9853162.1 NADH-quinone oxidoreductase subunit D [Dehalococcoidia bacterium]
MSPIKSEPFVLNIGPQHPSTHGVFRIKVTVDGELIQDAEMVMGYLHRSMEKLAEERTYTQNIPFTDRTDYLSSMANNLGYCLAVEKLAGIEVPPRGDAIRVIMAELQRLASHCMAIGAFANDTGAWQTPVMWAFREREKILDIFEMTSGARLTCNYMRIGGVAFELRPGFEERVKEIIRTFPGFIDEMEGLLTGNEIFIIRTRGVGVLSPETATSASLSGPMLRGSGIAWDIRKAEPYCGYEQYDFEIPIGYQGDSFDRFIVRLEEMRQSVKIIDQALRGLPGGPHSTQVPLALRPPKGEAYARVEGSRGELGYYLVSDEGPSPFRFHIRPPSFINLSALREMTVGGSIADAIVVLGSIDVVVGEIDR